MATNANNNNMLLKIREMLSETRTNQKLRTWETAPSLARPMPNLWPGLVRPERMKRDQ